MPSHQIIALLRGVSYLHELSIEIISALADAASPLRCTAGALIFVEGEPCAGLFLIEEGAVKISRFSKDGREYTLHMFDPGDTFNDIAALDGQGNPASATAHTDVVLWRIAREDLRAVAERHPRLAWALVGRAARRARFMADLVQDLSMRSVRGRLAHLLLKQARENAGNPKQRLLTQEEMASHLGTVREVVGRSLRGLAADGIIEFDRHHLIILDEARLEVEAEV